MFRRAIIVVVVVTVVVLPSSSNDHGPTLTRRDVGMTSHERQEHGNHHQQRRPGGMQGRRMGKVALRDEEPEPEMVVSEAVEAQALRAIQQDTERMNKQEKLFERDTKALNQKITQVENAVKKDLNGLNQKKFLMT